MKQTKKKIAALEEKLKHVGAPNDVIIYDPNDPNEPEASIKRFEEQYPDYPCIIVLPELERD